jgi:hypothetical protein
VLGHRLGKVGRLCVTPGHRGRYTRLVSQGGRNDFGRKELAFFAKKFAVNQKTGAASRKKEAFAFARPACLC